MGRMGETCGVVTGAYMALGLKYGPTQDDPEAKAAMYAYIREFAEKFTANHPGLKCRELLGYDMSIAEEYEKAKQENLFKTVCPQLVRDASEILETMLA
jgi:C_GCAxxG_C_C family probable redox protein